MTRTVDNEALERCIKLTLAEKDPGRVEQVKSMLADEPRMEVGLYCTYHRQMDALALKPYESPPSWLDPDDIETIIAAGPSEDFQSAKLAKQLIDAGLSIYEPDPLQALKDKKRTIRKNRDRK